jgi:hypothetical protein
LLGEIVGHYRITFWIEDARQDLSGRESCEGCVEPHIRLGQLDEALEELERSFENRDGDLIFLAVDSVYDPLRADPRFQDLLRRMKFPRSG